MIPAWIALCAWLVAWTVLAFESLALLSRVRPGETVPMRRKSDGSPTWRVSPIFAATFTPALAFVVGLFTIVVGYRFSGGRAPFMNVVLAVVFMLTHGMHVWMALKVLEQERR